MESIAPDITPAAREKLEHFARLSILSTMYVEEVVLPLQCAIPVLSRKLCPATSLYVCTARCYAIASAWSILDHDVSL